MSGGGGKYFPSRPETYHKRIEKSRDDAERQRLESGVNEYLQTLLSNLNQRDAEKINTYLDELGDILSIQGAVDRFLFGGSVAKHTYVDGLSDVDALVIMDRDEITGVSPATVLREFHQALQGTLTWDKVQSVDMGEMAVTIKYRDGTEIQLLPAIKSRGIISVPSADSKSWNDTNPQAFQQALTHANERLNNSLVPVIKLTKAIISTFPKPKQISGYHIEALCLEVAKGYRGPKTIKTLLTHVLTNASSRVTQPIQDITNQSRTVDSYLGKAHSTERRIVADALQAAARRLEAATSIDQWIKTIEG